jgi:hypothetical protein
MNNLALTYSDLGRHADALVMGEKALEYNRRVLPANHPNLGEGCCMMCGDCEGISDLRFDVQARP